jgi:hypothetical protein
MRESARAKRYLRGFFSVLIINFLVFLGRWRELPEKQKMEKA